MSHSTTTLGFSSALLRSLREPIKCPFHTSPGVQFCPVVGHSGECFLCGKTTGATTDVERPRAESSRTTPCAEC